MENMSTIPAPVEAMISGPGSFFGSCQVASSNFEAAFQSAMVSSGTSAAQSTATDAQPSGFGMMDFSGLKTFSDILEEYGENEVLGNLQEILGEDAGKDAFELALMVSQNDEAFEQLSLEDQMEVFRLFKILDMAETSTNDVKAFLEDWVKDVKNIFAELKIELKQPEELVSEPEEDTPLVAVSPEDLKNIKLLAKKMGIKPKDAPKFAALVNSLLKNGVITSKDLKDAVEVVSKEKELTPAGEFIGGLWGLVKNETKDEIENLVSGKLADLMGELVVDLPKNPVPNSVKENVSDSSKEPVIDLPEEPISNSAKEPVVDTSKENVYNSAKEPVYNSAKEDVSDTPENPVSNLKKESVSRSSKEPVYNSAKEPVSNLAKESVSGLVKADVSISLKEGNSNPLKENTFGLVDVPQESEEDKLANAFHLLIKRLKSNEPLTDEEKKELEALVEQRFLLKKHKPLEEDKLAVKEEVEVDDEESDAEELDIDEENKIGMLDEDEGEGEEDIAPEAVEDFDLLNILSDPKKLKKNKRKGFNSEAQQASQIQMSQQTLQTQPQQMRQIQQAQHQVQPEVRAVWEGEGLKIELVNPKTGEKLQTTYETTPQKMQERINEFEVVRQVIAQAKFITTPTGEQKMTMQLRPEHLGQVDLRITLNHGEMQIHARVESVTAQSALETHIGLLREGLEKHGITLDRLEVSVEQRDKQDAYSLAERQEQREQRQSNRRHHRGREQHLAVSTGKNESSDTGRRLGYNTMEYLA